MNTLERTTYYENYTYGHQIYKNGVQPLAECEVHRMLGVSVRGSKGGKAAALNIES